MTMMMEVATEPQTEGTIVVLSSGERFLRWEASWHAVGQANTVGAEQVPWSQLAARGAEPVLPEPTGYDQLIAELAEVWCLQMSACPGPEIRRWEKYIAENGEPGDKILLAIWQRYRQGGRH